MGDASDAAAKVRYGTGEARRAVKLFLKAVPRILTTHPLDRRYSSYIMGGRIDIVAWEGTRLVTEVGPWPRLTMARPPIEWRGRQAAASCGFRCLGCKWRNSVDDFQAITIERKRLT